MPSTATITPGSAEELYRSRRAAGMDHSEAVTATCHAYGRTPRDMAQRLDRVRIEWETPEPEIIEQEEIIEADPFEGREDAARARTRDLSEARGKLSADALSDSGKREQLAQVESQLAAAEAELEHIGLARAEGIRREREQRLQAQGKARAAARKRADRLEAEAGKSLAAIDTAMRSLAQALAAHADLDGRLNVELREAGGHGCREA